MRLASGLCFFSVTFRIFFHFKWKCNRLWQTLKNVVEISKQTGKVRYTRYPFWMTVQNSWGLKRACVEEFIHIWCDCKRWRGIVTISSKNLHEILNMSFTCFFQCWQIDCLSYQGCTYNRRHYNIYNTNTFINKTDVIFTHTHTTFIQTTEVHVQLYCTLMCQHCVFQFWFIFILLCCLSCHHSFFILSFF